MRGRFLLAALALLLAPGAAAADSLSYSNDRFGTRLTFPAEVFDTRLDPPDNGDGMSWTSRDGASLAVYGAYNVLEQTPAKLLADISARRAAEGEVTYARSRGNWVVVSGTAGPDIFYERHVFGADDIIHSVVLTYPRAQAGKYNPIVGPIANSLDGP
jgi:hypothetical protein